MCKLSIITINRNNADGLRKTIESVVSQTFTDFEYIVIDGASTDNSVEVIKEYTDKITYWISEPDKGIYNAMNKGIHKATGEYCLFLNSGDWLVDNSVINDFYYSNLHQDIISGNLMLKYEDGNDILWESESINTIGFDCLYARSLPHQATFIKNELFIRSGNFNEKNKIVSDREFFLKAIVFDKCSYGHFERLISFYDMNGISADQKYAETLNQELVDMFNHYLPPMVYKSYKKLWDENKKNRPIIREYVNLKNGKFGYLIKLILKMKQIKNQNSYV